VPSSSSNAFTPRLEVELEDTVHGSGSEGPGWGDLGDSGGMSSYDAVGVRMGKVHGKGKGREVLGGDGPVGADEEARSEGTEYTEGQYPPELGDEEAREEKRVADVRRRSHPFRWTAADEAMIGSTSLHGVIRRNYADNPCATRRSSSSPLLPLLVSVDESYAGVPSKHPLRTPSTSFQKWRW
jgi:hypothetical protein